MRVRELDGFVSLDVSVDVQDAMGANIVDTMMEAIVARLRAQYPQEHVLLGVLSNNATDALAKVTCSVPVVYLVPRRMLHTDSAHPADHEDFAAIGGRIARSIAEASDLAQVDPYRAATHNKGIMNGVAAVALATGNDTRAIEASCHAYACKDGSYRGLSTWSIGRDEGHDGALRLLGEMTLPMPMATVGGGTAALPAARAALSLLGVQGARELGMVGASVGLAQNLAALRALVTDGIQRGHMALQAHTLAIAAGAVGDEVERIAAAMIARGNAGISATAAQDELSRLRARGR